MQTQLNIFAYNDYRRFLADFYAEQKQLAPRRFSHRFFSRRAGFSSSNGLLLVIQGKRNLSHVRVHNLALALPLCKQRRKYFACLVEFNQTTEAGEKQRAFNTLLAFREYRDTQEISQAQYVLFARWYYTAIRELVNVRDFREDPKWIARTLQPNIPVGEAAQAVAALCEAGLLVRDDLGRLRQATRTIRTPPEVRAAALLSFHHDMIGHGQRSLALPATAREISALTMSMTHSQFQLLREKIRAFHEDIQAWIASTPSDVEAEAVVQCSCQLFPLSKMPAKP